MSSPRILRPTLFLVSVLVLMAIPTALVSVIGWTSAALITSLCAISAIFNVMGFGWRGLVWSSSTTALAVLFGVVSSSNPWGSALLMLAVGLFYGWGNNRGLSAGNMVLPMIVAATIGSPPTITHIVLVDSVISALIAAGSMLFAGGIALAFMSRSIHAHAEIPQYSRKVNSVYTFNLSVLFATTGYLTALHHDQIQGMWLALTIVLIISPYIDASVRRGFERAGGTILGFLIALGVATAIPATGLYYVVGLLFIELAVLSKINATNSYWLFVMFLTPGIVLVSGEPSQVTQFADWRLFVTMVAVTACLLLLGAERLLFYKGSLNKEPQQQP
jgi:hypothetical protein